MGGGGGTHSSQVCVCVTAFCNLSLRLEVWRRVRPLRCISGRVRPSRGCSWLPVTPTGPEGRAPRRSGTVRCVVSCCRCRGIHHGCTWDRSDDRGTHTHAHSHIHTCSRLSGGFSLSIFALQKVSLDGFPDGDLDERSLQDSKYDILEFARKYFRRGPGGKGWDKEK